MTARLDIIKMHLKNFTKNIIYNGILYQDLSYKEKHWHETCFRCSKCGSSLVDKQFGSKADR